MITKILLLGGILWIGSATAADIVVGVPNWPSVEVTAQLIKLVMEDNLGLSVEIQSAANPIIFGAIARGSMDIHPEVWLPNQQNLFDKYRYALRKNLHPAVGVQGMCVNGAAQRAGINDISDLTDPVKAALFDQDGRGHGQIIIGAPGWSSTIVEEIKAAQYGYGQILELEQLDEGLANTQLNIAERRGVPWVGACYAPNYRFVQHPDLKLLTEPHSDPRRWKVIQPDESSDWIARSYVTMQWPAQTVQPVYARRLEKSHPMAATMMRNMDLRADELSEFSYKLVIERRSAQDIADTWRRAHQGRIDAWLR